MTARRRFTLRAGKHYGTVTFDDDPTSHTLSRDTVDAIIGLLNSAATEPSTFSAAALASFAEASDAGPSPTSGGPLIDLAKRRPGAGAGAGATVLLGPRARTESDPLAAVLERRRSGVPTGPLKLDDLATVLVRSCRVIDWDYDDRGIEVSLRPHPSAGAMHPLHVEILANDMPDLDAGRWTFDPFTCSLTRTDTDGSTSELIGRFGPPSQSDYLPAVIVIRANPAATLSRYPNGTAHLWRDTGALLATLHLVAADCGLTSKILGTSGVISPLDPHGAGDVDVGALLIGTD